MPFSSHRMTQECGPSLGLTEYGQNTLVPQEHSRTHELTDSLANNRLHLQRHCREPV